MLSIVKLLILDIFVVNGEWVNLEIVSVAAWFYEDPYSTDSVILFLFRFG